MTISVAHAIRAVVLGFLLAGWSGGVYAQAPGTAPATAR